MPHPLLSLKVDNTLRKYIKIFNFFLAREDNITMCYFKGASFQSLKDPKSEDAGKNIVESWITQSLDYFNHRRSYTVWKVIIIIAQSYSIVLLKTHFFMN